MINMNDLDNDPWSTYPVQKDDLRSMHNLILSLMMRVQELEGAICHWADAIVDWEGVTFADRITHQHSRLVIEKILNENGDEN